MKAIGALKNFGTGGLIHPAYLIFFVTSKCVGRCKHCFYWDSINQPEEPLTVEEVEKTAASMGDLLQVTFTGGEPFLRDDFPRLAEAFHKHNRVYHLGVATSGYLVERTAEGVKEILERCPESNLTVGLPIEGPAELNNDIRGREDFFERTAETLERLKSLKDPGRKLTILVDITASGMNRGRLIETYEMVRDDLSPDNINVILTRGAPREERAKDLDPVEGESLFRLMEEDIRKGRVRGYGFFSRLIHAKDVVLRRMALDIYKDGLYRLPCEAGRVAGVIMPEGRVFPCELLDRPLGELRESDYDMVKIWTSDKARRVRDEIVDNKCVCYHQCFLSNTIFWNLSAWPAMLRELVKFGIKG